MEKKDNVCYVSFVVACLYMFSFVFSSNYTILSVCLRLSLSLVLYVCMYVLLDFESHSCNVISKNLHIHIYYACIL